MVMDLSLMRIPGWSVMLLVFLVSRQSTCLRGFREQRRLVGIHLSSFLCLACLHASKNAVWVHTCKMAVRDSSSLLGSQITHAVLSDWLIDTVSDRQERQRIEGVKHRVKKYTVRLGYTVSNTEG